jgi:uncharacterized cofD-like protein
MKPDSRIVVIGGGTGVFTVLTGLRSRFKNLAAIVTMADDGGSTGALREDFGVLPPGDIRRALIALSKTDNKILSALFNYRFKEGAGLHGHSFGNLMLTALERITGSFESAIREAARILRVEGSVIPVTLKQTKLFAELENGAIIKGESNIDVPKHDGQLRIKRVWLRPAAAINPNARKALLVADLIIIGPGDLYTSIIPNLLVSGIKTTLQKTKAKIIYLINLMTKFGETNGFAASDFVKEIEKYLGRGVVDYVVVSNRRPAVTRLKKYKKEKAEWVRFDKKNFGPRPKLIPENLIRSSGFIRHAPEKIAELIARLM